MGYVSGLYSGLTYTVAKLNNAQEVAVVDNLLQTFIDARREDSIVAIVQMPTAFTTIGEAVKVEVETAQKATQVDGYTPRNKKLLTYPYCFMALDSLDSSKIFRYEWFGSTNMEFVYTCAMSATPEINVSPRNYNGTDGINYSERLVVTGFPQCPWAIDTYRAWVAQKASLANASYGKGMLSTLASVSGAGAMFGPQGAFIAGAIGSIGLASQALTYTLQATEGDKARGNVGSSTAVGGRYKKVYYKYMSVSKQYAKMIDDYFDRFGYSCGRIKVPNRNVRPHWTYTKTTDVAIRGHIPVEDMDEIKSIYNKGITFWKNGSEVGNYALDNRV